MRKKTERQTPTERQTSPVAKAARVAAQERQREQAEKPSKLVRVFVLEYRVEADVAHEDGIDRVIETAQEYGSCEIIDEDVVKGKL